MLDLIIVGGGASGMIAASYISQNSKDLKIAILEKNKILGRKINATGNGRCNITNALLEGAEVSVAFFNSIGISTFVEDEGRVYPYSEKAEDVVLALENSINADVYLNSEVVSLKKIKTGYSVSYIEDMGDKKNKKTLEAKCVLISTGGKASPNHGSTGDGYRMAKELSHEITPLAPALTPIECSGNLSFMKGKRVKAKLTILEGGESVYAEKGQLQLTDYGVSGIPAFNGSFHIGKNTEDFKAEIDFFPDINVYEELLHRRKLTYLQVKDITRTLLDSEISSYILMALKYDLEAKASTLSDEDIKRIARNFKHFRLKISGLKGWKNAQITRGGVMLSGVNPDSMESKYNEGIYFSGEVLDMQGYCGGYNLQIAWETGIKVAKDIINKGSKDV